MLTRLLCLAALVSAAGCSPRSTAQPLPPDRAQKLLLDRNWIDRLPRNEHTQMHVYRFVPSMGSGVFQDRTIFAGRFELFRFENTGEEIRFDLLHTHDKHTSRYRIEQLDEKERRGSLDLRLRVDRDPRGPGVYFGSSREAGNLDAALTALPMDNE